MCPPSTQPLKSRKWIVSNDQAFRKDDFYLPGETKFKMDNSLRKLLKPENLKLKEQNTKIWLKKKVQFDKFREPGSERPNTESDNKNSKVKRQYLMSE